MHTYSGRTAHSTLKAPGSLFPKSTHPAACLLWWCPPTTSFHHQPIPVVIAFFLDAIEWVQRACSAAVVVPTTCPDVPCSVYSNFPGQVPDRANRTRICLSLVRWRDRVCLRSAEERCSGTSSLWRKSGIRFESTLVI